MICQCKTDRFELRKKTMANLMYRGINYPSLTAVDKSSKSKMVHKVILIRPIHYYTYRGISYIKNLTYDLNSNSLLDINRQ